MPQSSSLSVLAPLFVALSASLVLTACKFQQEKPAEQLSVVSAPDPKLRNVYWQLDKEHPDTLINGALGVAAMDGSNNDEISVDYQRTGKNVITQDEQNYKLDRHVPYDAANNAHPDILVVEVSGYFSVDTKIYDATFQCGGVMRPLRGDTSFLNGGLIAYFHFSGFRDALAGLPAACSEANGRLLAKIQERGAEKTFEVVFQPAPLKPKSESISYKEFDRSGYAYGLDVEPVRHIRPDQSRKHFELVAITKITSPNKAPITLEIPSQVSGGARLFFREYHYDQNEVNGRGYAVKFMSAEQYCPIEHRIKSGGNECTYRSESVGGTIKLAVLEKGISPDAILTQLSAASPQNGVKINMMPGKSTRVGIYIEYANTDDVLYNWFEDKDLPMNSDVSENVRVGDIVTHGWTNNHVGPNAEWKVMGIEPLMQLSKTKGREYYGMSIVLNPHPSRSPAKILNGTLGRVRYTELHEDMDISSVHYELFPTVVPVADGSLCVSAECYGFYENVGKTKGLGKAVHRDFLLDLN